MQLSKNEIRDIILDIEKKFPVETWRVAGIHIWPLVRIPLSVKLFYIGRDIEKENKIHKKYIDKAKYFLSLIKLLLSYVCITLFDRKHNVLNYSCVEVVFLTLSSHRTKLRNGWYDVFCDPFVEIFNSIGKRCVVLEISLFEKIRMPRCSPSKLITPSLIYVRLIDKLNSKKNETEVHLDKYDEFLDYLKKLNVVSCAPSKRKIIADSHVLRVYTDYFKKILNKTRTRIVFIAEYYSSQGMAMNLACRECGVLSVDIQHGVQGEYHAAYSFFTKVPDTGFELLPSVFWCWSDSESSEIRKWCEKVSSFHRPFVGGNLWVGLWKGKDSQIVSYYDSLVERMKKKGCERVVLFTPSLISDLHDWILAAIKESSVNCQWWIRIHPCFNHQRENFRAILRSHGVSGVELDSATDLPLFALLRHIDVNVTSYSTTVLEAEAFEVASVLTDPNGPVIFKEQIKSGCAVAAYTTNELMESILVQSSKKNIKKHKSGYETTNSFEAVGKFLTEINMHECH